MKRVVHHSFVLFVLLALVAGLMAHPHIRKTVEAKLGSVDAKITFFTVPANEDHIAKVEVGSFRGGGQLELSADLTAGGVTIPAGSYTPGAIRDSSNGWTMVLYPGKVGRGESPDMSKLIKLNSAFSHSGPKTEHAYWDIGPGHGKMSGKAVLVWHFGSLYLAGALS